MDMKQDSGMKLTVDSVAELLALVFPIGFPNAMFLGHLAEFLSQIFPILEVFHGFLLGYWDWATY